MSFAPDHVQLREQLPDAVLGLLSPRELQRVLEHTRGCKPCAGLLREYREVVAGLALLAPAAPPDAIRDRRLRERLQARLRDGRAASPRHGMDLGLGWIVAAGLGGVLLMHHAVHRPLDFGWLAAGVLAIVLAAVGAYAGVQRGRLEVLRQRLERGAGEPGES